MDFATIPPARRFACAMTNSNVPFGLIVGGIVAVFAMLFIFSGGEWGGKTTVESDRDLPPVTETVR